MPLRGKSDSASTQAVNRGSLLRDAPLQSCAPRSDLDRDARTHRTTVAAVNGRTVQAVEEAKMGQPGPSP